MGADKGGGGAAAGASVGGTGGGAAFTRGLNQANWGGAAVSASRPSSAAVCSQGARAIRNAGGRVVVESERTATVFGMPGAAIRADVVDEILGLPDIAAYLAGLGI